MSTLFGCATTRAKFSASLYASAEGFPKDSQKAIRRDSSSISEKKASCEFPGIEPGTYAVSLFHDENSNGKLDTNFLGIPREGVGASNDARDHMGRLQTARSERSTLAACQRSTAVPMPGRSEF